MKTEDIVIEYYPTELILADFFTKPLQCTVFVKPWIVIMGWKPIEPLRDVSLV